MKRELRKWVKIIPMFVVCVSLLSACSDDDNSSNEDGKPGKLKGAIVLNQGNFYTHISSSIGTLDMENGVFTDSVFFRKNGIIPGNTLQAGIIYGSHFYAIAYESNVLFVTNAQDLALQQSVAVTAPRALAASDGYLFITNYDGHVTKLDTVSMSVAGSVEVGPNPEEMAVANGYLYVANSDGMNYENGYANGKSVSKIKLSTFTVEKTIPTGLNPVSVKSDSRGNVFVVAMGDYAAVPSKIQRIDTQDNVTDVAEASMMTIQNDTLYALSSETDWSTFENHNKCFKMSTKDLKASEAFITDGVEWPIAIAVHPTENRLYITSDNQGTYGADYNSRGYVCEFALNGTKIARYTTGVHPVQIVFK